MAKTAVAKIKKKNNIRKIRQSAVGNCDQISITANSGKSSSCGHLEKENAMRFQRSIRSKKLVCSLHIQP